MASASETVSFKTGELLEPLEAMLAEMGLSRTEFFKQMTAAAIELHQRGDNPISTMTKMPVGGFAALETERAVVSQLVVAAHKSLKEMQTAVDSLWPVVVGVGVSAVKPGSITEILDEVPITLTRAYTACDKLTATVHQFTSAWIATADSLVEAAV